MLTQLLFLRRAIASRIYHLLQDYEDFDIANEDDELEEFLGIPRKSPKFDPNAGTNSGEPGTKPDQPTGNGNSTDKR